VGVVRLGGASQLPSPVKSSPLPLPSTDRRRSNPHAHNPTTHSVQSSPAKSTATSASFHSTASVAATAASQVSLPVRGHRLALV